MPLTAAAIVTLATQIAKCPSFTFQAGQLLNMILSDLCQSYDLGIARGATNFTFNTGNAQGSGPYVLPADWLRANRNDVFYTIAGVKYVMVGIELAEFDALVQQAGINAYPQNYTVDVNSGVPQMLVWPPAGGSYPVTARYQRQMPDIATPEGSTVVPWFPNQNYLKTRLAGELMQITNDDRAEKFLGDGAGVTGEPMGAKAILDSYLKMQDESGDVVKTVTLDRRRFGSRFDRVKNTKTIGW